MTRADHLAWAKERALEYVERGELHEAFQSLASDLNKHNGTRGHAGIMIGMSLMMMNQLSTPEQMRDFIEGFN